MMNLNKTVMIGLSDIIGTLHALLTFDSHPLPKNPGSAQVKSQALLNQFRGGGVAIAILSYSVFITNS